MYIKMEYGRKRRVGSASSCIRFQAVVLLCSLLLTTTLFVLSVLVLTVFILLYCELLPDAATPIVSLGILFPINFCLHLVPPENCFSILA